MSEEANRRGLKEFAKESPLTFMAMVAVMHASNTTRKKTLANMMLVVDLNVGR